MSAQATVTTGLRIRADRVATVAGLVTVGLWGSAFVGIRAVAVDLSPASIALGRLVIGSLLLMPLVARRGWVKLSRRDAALVIGMGVAWSAGYSIVLGAGERLVDAGTAAMLVGIGPILITVLAGLVLGEGWPPRLLIGCAIAFGGTVVIGSATAAQPAGSGAIAGIALCVLAALLYAIGVTLQKPVLRAVPGIQVTWLACLIGAIACLPFAPTLADELGRARPDTLSWLLYLGVFPTSIGFTTWAFALGRMSAGRAGTLSYLVSPTAILISWLLLGETPAALAILGGALCVLGVIVARSRSRAARIT
jgi:drug/metabolite transporter (DMT)-like permease